MITRQYSLSGAATAVVIALVAMAGLASSTPSTASRAAANAQLAAPIDCPAGHSCYYDGLNYVALLWVAPSCGFFDLGKMTPPKNDRIESIYNGGGAGVLPYNWGGSWQPVGFSIPPGVGANFNGKFGNIIDAVQVC
ncbi:hypothetical protein [Actinophytocola oryzae]|uniref:hypothetical protein n=1 Tax=Actinophytocola oryzae TaxID=502181 RepID=UPI001414FE3A|nr:hypothetical protein [Actinophytocola oryzae]